MRKLIALVFGALTLVPAAAFGAVDTDGTCQDAAGGVLAVCGESSLLSSCERSELVCKEIGGTFTAASGAASDAYCDNDNDLLPDCTLDFIYACVRAGGTFNRYDTIGASGECVGV